MDYFRDSNRKNPMYRQDIFMSLLDTGSSCSWNGWGSNPWPLACEANAHPGWATVPYKIWSNIIRKEKRESSDSLFSCGRWDLNPHAVASTRSLVLLVCQFRHFRIFCYLILNKKRMQEMGLEPTLCKPQQAPEACASANSATPANRF